MLHPPHTTCHATVAAIAFMVLASGVSLADRVEWSDGRTWEGRIELSDGSLLRLHDGTSVREWTPADVAGITLAPVTQRLERAWRFIEAGKTAKEFTGDPYPTAELGAAVVLRSGDAVRGHLLTTVFYLTATGRTEKLVIKFKLRGNPGQTATNLVYPAAITLEPVATPSVAGRHVTVRLVGAPPATELALVSRARMAVARVRREGGDAFAVELDGGDVVAAVRTGNRITASWRGTVNAASRVRLEQGLRDLRDFFDDRQLLAASQDPADPTTCHTLLLLARAGRTTFDAAASLPWRVEVWKWRLGEDKADITAASRAVLLRGIRAPHAPLPEVVVDEAMGRALEALTAETVLMVTSQSP